MSRQLLPDLAESLDPDEMDVLHEALFTRNGEQGPLLDGLHGLVTAILVGPQPVPREEWLPLVLHPEQTFESHLEAERLTSLCLRVYHGIERGLEQLVYEPILAEFDDEDTGERIVEAQGWCAGFSLGVDLRAQLWEPRLRFDPRLMEIMAPIMALAFSEGLFEEFSDPRWPPLTETEREACVQMIPSCVIDIQHYWRDHPPQIEPIGRSRPKIARKRGGRWVH